MRVLLVEDTDDLRFLFARILRVYGCEVFEAADAFQALAATEDFTPDLVLTDLMMPGMDGIELIRRLRAIPRYSAMTIVAITADCTSETKHLAREAGATDFVVKPIAVHDLLARLKAWAD